LEKNPTITIAFDGHFPPYSYISDNGDLEGYSIDIVNLISEILDVEFSIHPQLTWKELYESAIAQQVDMVATMVERPDRREWFNFSPPYIFKSLVIMTRNDDERIKHRDDLVNKKIALVSGYQYVQRIIEEYPNIEPYYVDTLHDAVNAVSIGKADASITYLGAGNFIRNKFFLSNLKFAAVYDKEGSPESFAIGKTNPELASIIEKALNAISADKILELQQKWLPIEFMNSLKEINLTDEEINWIEQHPVIRLGIDPEFAPFEFMDGDQYSGMASDYIRILNQRLNIDMQVVPNLSWDEVIIRAESKQIDVLPAVGKTEQREQYLLYTAPYLSFQRVIVMRSDAPYITGLDEIDHLKISVQVNTSHHGYIEENTDIIPVKYPTLQEGLLSVSSGQSDAFVGNVASSTYWMRKLNLTNLKISAPTSNEIKSLHFAIRDDWPELNSIIQKGLDSISPATQEEISRRWTSVEFEPTHDYQYIWNIVIVMLVVTGAVVLWNISLKRKVKQRSSELLRHAYYDQLTGAANRFLIQDRLNQLINEATTNQSKLAILSVDVDNFNRVNTSVNHRIGDLILAQISGRLQSNLRPSDTLGRLGGDHFLVLVSHISSSADVASIVESMLACFSTPFQVEDQKITLSATVGISLFPEDGRQPETLIKNADSATHHAKQNNSGTYFFYKESLNHQVSRQFEIETNIRSALERSEIFVVYQPKVTADSGKIVGFEALLRWKSKSLGFVSPSEFVPIAEKIGLIVPIGQFVLQQALKVCKELEDEFKRSFVMAVNLSPRQFKPPEFYDQLKNTIVDSGVEFNQLELEITEGVLMGADEAFDDLLNRIKSLGVRLAMDDFGTGYSSMSYLRKFKFDTLKIDREFIHDLYTDVSDRQLVIATIAMARSMDMTVVAEGVETKNQQDFLASQQCDLLQGYLFSPPVPVETIKKLIATQLNSGIT